MVARRAFSRLLETWLARWWYRKPGSTNTRKLVRRKGRDRAETTDRSAKGELPSPVSFLCVPCYRPAPSSTARTDLDLLRPRLHSNSSTRSQRLLEAPSLLSSSTLLSRPRLLALRAALRQLEVDSSESEAFSDKAIRKDETGDRYSVERRTDADIASPACSFTSTSDFTSSTLSLWVVLGPFSLSC